MAIYRPRTRWRALPLVAALVIGLVAGLTAGRLTSPGLTSQVAELRTDASALRTSLDVLRLEYHKLLDSEGDPGGAEAALERAMETFGELRASLAAIDPSATEQLAESLDRLGEQVTARESADSVEAAVEDASSSLARVFGDADGGGG